MPEGSTTTLPDMGAMMKDVADRLSAIETGYLPKTDADNAYLGKNDKAKSAKTADSATKASQDAQGNDIAATYQKAAGTSAIVTGNETAKVQATAVTFNDTSAKTVHLTGAAAITVQNGGAGKAWDASALIDKASATITLGSNWHWLGKEPTVKANSLLVLHWCDTFGIANLQTVS